MPLSSDNEVCPATKADHPSQPGEYGSPFNNTDPPLKHRHPSHVRTTASTLHPPQRYTHRRKTLTNPPPNILLHLHPYYPQCAAPNPQPSPNATTSSNTESSPAARNGPGGTPAPPGMIPRSPKSAIQTGPTVVTAIALKLRRSGRNIRFVRRAL